MTEEEKEREEIERKKFKWKVINTQVMYIRDVCNIH